jgi:hypothetical protein
MERRVPLDLDGCPPRLRQRRKKRFHFAVVLGGRQNGFVRRIDLLDGGRD